MPLAEYLTEQEQVELLKSWIKQYSATILLGIVLAAVAIFGWRYWQEREAKLESHASLIFDEMLTARTQRNAEAVTLTTNKLAAHYSRTVYGSFAALMQAREAVNQHQFAEAEKKLNEVIHHSHVASLKQIARLRLARILIATGEANKGIEALNTVDDPHFEGLIDEVKGDAYLALNQPTTARQWYGAALQALPDAETIYPLLQIKYDNLAVKA
jgi:predicted negative regulator of RcsB-dependent stress response